MQEAFDPSTALEIAYRRNSELLHSSDVETYNSVSKVGLSFVDDVFVYWSVGEFQLQ